MILTHDGESVQQGTLAFENKHGSSSIYGTFLNTIFTHNINFI